MNPTTRRTLYYIGFLVLGLGAAFVCAAFLTGAKTGSDFGLEIATGFFFLGAYALKADKPLVIGTLPLRVLVGISGILSLTAFAIHFAK